MGQIKNIKLHIVTDIKSKYTCVMFGGLLNNTRRLLTQSYNVGAPTTILNAIRTYKTVHRLKIQCLGCRTTFLRGRWRVICFRYTRHKQVLGTLNKHEKRKNKAH